MVGEEPTRKEENMESMEVAKVIQSQIGHKAFMMLGAKDLMAVEQGLQFKIRGSSKANVVRITLEPSDTYKIEFVKSRGMNFKTVAQYEGVYVDMLHSLIEKETGLYTSL